MVRSFYTSCWMSALKRTKAFTKSGHTRAFQSGYVNDTKVRFSNIQIEEFARLSSERSRSMFWRTSSRARSRRDARDVHFYLRQLETQFRILPKPLMNLDENLQDSFERGVNVRIIDKSHPARTPVQQRSVKRLIHSVLCMAQK